MKRALVALAALSVAGAARGQEAPGESARRELIAQAEQAAGAGDHARALDLAGRAAALRPSPSLTWLLAREHRALDHFVEALDHARACVRAAEADASLRNRDTIRHACEAIQASVEPRVGRVEVAVASARPEGLVVRLDGRELLPALYGVPVPVDPGPHVVEAAAPGHLPLRREEAVAEASSLRVEVSLEREPVPVAVAPAVVVPPVVISPAPRPAPIRTGPGPWVVGGVGAAGLVTAAVFAGLASAEQSARDGECDRSGCTAAALPHDAAYVDYLAATNVALAAGAAVLVSGAIWYFAPRVLGRRRATPRPAVTAGRAGFSVAF